jgi:hypothetical protein
MPACRRLVAPHLGKTVATWLSAACFLFPASGPSPVIPNAPFFTPNNVRNLSDPCRAEFLPGPTFLRAKIDGPSQNFSWLQTRRGSRVAPGGNDEL